MSSEEEINEEICQKYRRKPKMEVSVEVDSKQFKELTRENVELEQENEDLKSKLRIIAEQKFKEKKERLGAPDSIRTPSELKEWVEENENNSNSEPPIGRGSSGSLKLSSAQTGQEEGFDSQEAMIDFLVNQKHSTENTPEQREQAKKVLGELYRKTFEGLKKGTGRQGEIFVDPLKDGKSLM